MITEKATSESDLPHAHVGLMKHKCILCGRNADADIHKPNVEQASLHGEPLQTEKGS